MNQTKTSKISMLKIRVQFHKEIKIINHSIKFMGALCYSFRCGLETTRRVEYNKFSRFTGHPGIVSTVANHFVFPRTSLFWSFCSVSRPTFSMDVECLVFHKIGRARCRILTIQSAFKRTHAVGICCYFVCMVRQVEYWRCWFSSLSQLEVGQ